jgi:hypothetical protein
MKNEESRQTEEKVKPTEEQANANRESDDRPDSDKKETIEERAKREHWTDVAESHLGIDE